ncbi:hypothetical protein HMSSN036_23330 [Paenibacillus macerans]|nr:hypothetical protein HMSSN036_23330 [Paenibacillus macerans]
MKKPGKEMKWLLYAKPMNISKEYPKGSKLMKRVYIHIEALSDEEIKDKT